MSESKKVFNIKEVSKNTFEVCCIDINGIEFYGKFTHCNDVFSYPASFKWLDSNTYKELMKTINVFLKKREKEYGKI